MTLFKDMFLGVKLSVIDCINVTLGTQCGSTKLKSKGYIINFKNVDHLIYYSLILSMRYP